MNESPLCVQPSLAVAIGLNEAIFLQQCHYWLNPKFNKNFIEGRHWVHKTLHQWSEQFPFWGEKTIRRVISNLENLKIIISNVTSNGFKKTKFYTIDYDVLNEQTSSNPTETLGAYPCGQNDQIDLPKRADGSGHIDQFDVDNMTISYMEERLLSKNTSSLSSDPRVESFWTPKKNEREEFSNSKKMLEIWNQLVPEKSVNGANSYLSKQLESALRDQLDGDLSSWKSVCENFRSSKFLMGEVDSIRVKPDLSWLVDPKEPRVSRVFQKQHYTFGDRKTETKPLDFEATESAIEALDEPKISKEVRLFIFQNNPGFYKSYVDKTVICQKGEEVLILSSSGLSRDKIQEQCYNALADFLKQRYQLGLVIKTKEKEALYALKE